MAKSQNKLKNTLCMYENSGGKFIFFPLAQCENWTESETLDSLSLMAATF
jgi:hypothetical protein